MALVLLLLASSELAVLPAATLCALPFFLCELLSPALGSEKLHFCAGSSAKPQAASSCCNRTAPAGPAPVKKCCFMLMIQFMHARRHASALLRKGWASMGEMICFIARPQFAHLRVPLNNIVYTRLNT